MVFASCGEDRWPAYRQQTGHNLWIDSIMRQDYLWVDGMPASKELTTKYFYDAAKFLSAVRSSADGVSRVDTAYTGIKTVTSQGFSLSLYSLSSTERAALVTYVDAGSPAHEAGIERGDWILEVDGEPITSSTQSLLTDGDSHTLTMGHFTAATDDDNGALGTVTADRKTTIPAATTYVPDDIPIAMVIDNSTGYLVCNDICSTNISSMTAAAKTFADAGISNLVLDLRYCDDGDISGLGHLASLLVPSSDAGRVLGYLNYATSSSYAQITLYLSSDDSSQVLNLTNLYVLTSTTTSGVPEMLIDCLRQYLNVVVIGQATAGNNVVCNTYTNSTYSLCLHLATCTMANPTGTADYAGTGIRPDQEANQYADPSTVLPLGNSREVLLGKALAIIAGE